MTRTEYKMQICEKHSIYLHIINSLGNGVMLQKQFQEICTKLYVLFTDYQMQKVLKELEDADIIRKQYFLHSKNKLIVLRKFALRFLQNKDSSSKVSSLPKNLDKRSIYSALKCEIFLQIINGYDIDNWDKFLDKLYDLNSSLLYTNNQGVLYHKMLIEKYQLDFYTQQMYSRGCDNYNKMLRCLNEKNNNAYTENLSVEAYINYILSENKKSKLNLETISMNNFINSHLHIQSMIDLPDSKIIEILIFDLNNTQNVNKIIDKIILSCAVIREIFKDSKIEFRFKVVAWDYVAKNNLKSKLGKKEAHKDINYVRDKLSSYKYDGRNVLLDLSIDIEDINIRLTHVDFYRKFLDNRKIY